MKMIPILWVAAAVLLALVGSGVAWWVNPALFLSAPIPEPSLAQEAQQFFPPQADPPKLVLDQEEYDFGMMNERSEGTHDFIVRNEGKGELKLQLRETSCKCTGLEMGKGRVAPGEQLKLTLHWETGVSRGPFRQSAVLITNDPEKNPLQISITGEVQQFLGVYPTVLTFADVDNEKPSSRVFNVWSTGREDLQLTDLRVSRPERYDVTRELMAQEVREKYQAKIGYVITVTAKPGMPIGEFSDELIFQTNLKERPEEKLAIRGKVSGPITILPANAGKRGVVSHKVPTKWEVKLWVRSDKSRQPELVSVKSDLEFLKARGHRHEKYPKCFVIDLEIPSGAKPGSFRGLVEVEINLGEAAGKQEVKIPVSFIVGAA